MKGILAAILVVFVCIFCYIPLAWILGRGIRMRQERQARENGTVYLTFDDGPGNRLTPQILDILHKHNIQASFFVLGRNVVGREAIVQRIRQGGHCITSHTFSHIHAWKQWPWKIIKDIRKGFQVVNACLLVSKKGYPFRPPCGKMNIFSYLYLRFSRIPIIYWSIDSRDTWLVESRNPEFAADQIRHKKGGIVLFHDFDRSTDETDCYVLQSLESVIRTAKEMNLRFSTVDELAI